MKHFICVKSNEVKYNVDVMRAFGLNYKDFTGLTLKEYFWDVQNQILFINNNKIIQSINFKLAFKNATWYVIVDTQNKEIFNIAYKILQDFLRATHIKGEMVKKIDGDGIYVLFTIDYNNNKMLWKHQSCKVLQFQQQLSTAQI